MSRIMMVTDAWHPQVNGVVRSIEETTRELIREGHDVCVLGPDTAEGRVFALPSYPEIRLDFFSKKRLKRKLSQFNPDFIHIATEGPMGVSMRALCRRTHRSFTTAYHTQFPNYMALRVPFMVRPFVRSLCYAYLRWFHRLSHVVLVTTSSIAELLSEHGIPHTGIWPKGVDLDLFKPRAGPYPYGETFAHPLMLYVGRIAVEKNIEAFLSLKRPGTKVLVGDGPDRQALQSRYPEACFLGQKAGLELARCYNAADVFVFPSKSETFGLVLIEACSSGLRIASYPASGPKDIFNDPEAKYLAVLNEDLGLAISEALKLPINPSQSHEFAQKFSWRTATLCFYRHQVPSTNLPLQE